MLSDELGLHAGPGHGAILRVIDRADGISVPIHANRAGVLRIVPVMKAHRV